MKTRYQLLITAALLGMASYAYLFTGEHDSAASLSIEETSNFAYTQTSEKNQTSNGLGSEENTELCDEFFDHALETPEWQQLKAEQIKTMFIALKDQGYRSDKYDLMAVSTGIGLHKGRDIREQQGENNSLFANIIKQQRTFGRSQSVLFNRYLMKKDFVEMIKAFSDKTFPINKYVQGRHYYLSPIALVIESVEDSFTVVSHLIDAGVVVTYHDLMTATEFGFDENKLSYLYNNSQLDAAKVWRDDGRYESLVTIALAHRQLEAFSYWLSQGSPPVPDAFSKNTLDKLSLVDVKADYETIERMFVVLMQYDVIAHNANTYSNLKSWLKPALFNQYETQLKRQHPYQASPELQQDVSNATIQFMNTLFDTSVTTSTHSEQVVRCFIDKAKERVSQLFSAQLSENALKDSDPLEHRLIKANQLLVQTKLEQGSAKNILAKLAINRDWVTKLAADIYMDERIRTLDERIRTLSKQSQRYRQQYVKNLSEADRKRYYQLFNEIRKYNGADKWSKIVAAFQELKNIRSRYLNADSSVQRMEDAHLMFLALYLGKGIEVIKELISHGAVFPTYTVGLLSVTDNIVLLKQLVALGLDLYQSNLDGENGLVDSINNQAIKMTEYLIYHGVSIAQNVYGSDALDHVLTSGELSNNNIMHITSLLINAGAMVELSHQQATRHLKVTNAPLYQQLIERFVELKLPE